MFFIFCNFFFFLLIILIARPAGIIPKTSNAAPAVAVTPASKNTASASKPEGKSTNFFFLFLKIFFFLNFLFALKW